MALTAQEQWLCEQVAARETELVELLRTLVSFDTLTQTIGEPARDEAALQEYLAGRLRSSGASVTLVEPDPGDLAGHPMAPAGLSFSGRPQLVARMAGRGAGRTLLLNGHVDVVTVEPREQWVHDPHAGVLGDGRVHGRGACDMKGGVAAMVFAAEMLSRLGIRLVGDLVVNTVTEEESTGAGGLYSARTLRADAAIVPEPTGLEVWVACRGSLLPSIVVEGRAAHAAIRPLPADRGGAVNAIEKMQVVLQAIAQVRAEWLRRPPHPYLAPPGCVPTMVTGGEWLVSYPASCRLDCHIQYLPDQADERGWGSRVQEEFTRAILEATAADPWLRDHPPRIEWPVGGVPPAEVPPGHPVVHAVQSAVRDLGGTGALGGLDNWHDGATLTVEGGIPAVCFGPGDINLAHTTRESVPVDQLVRCAQALAVAAMRFCGVA